MDCSLRHGVALLLLASGCSLWSFDEIDGLGLQQGVRSKADKDPLVVGLRSAEVVTDEGGKVLKIGGPDSQSQYSIYLPPEVTGQPFLIEFEAHPGSEGWLGLNLRANRTTSQKFFGVGLGSKGHMKADGVESKSLPKVDAGSTVAFRVKVDPGTSRFSVAINGGAPVEMDYPAEISPIETATIAHIAGQGGFIDQATVRNLKITPVTAGKP